VFAGLLLATPIWAAHSNSVSWTVTEPTTIGGTEIKAGDYVIKVDDGGSQLQVLSRGKVVAQLTQLSAKAQASEVDADGGKVTQIKFAGKNSAVSFNN
jgi:TRAP-type mannitol/chloroaromatic compound transport system substrate-binding protein